MHALRTTVGNTDIDNSVWNTFESFLEHHGPLIRYVILCVANAPGMPGTFPPPLRVSDLDMHHGTCVTHVPWCMTGSLTSGFLWSRWQGMRSRHSRHMCSPQFYISGKRSMVKFIRKIDWLVDTTWYPRAINLAISSVHCLYHGISRYNLKVPWNESYYRNPLNMIIALLLRNRLLAIYCSGLFQQV